MLGKQQENQSFLGPQLLPHLISWSFVPQWTIFNTMALFHHFEHVQWSTTKTKFQRSQLHNNSTPVTLTPLGIDTRGPQGHVRVRPNYACSICCTWNMMRQIDHWMFGHPDLRQTFTPVLVATKWDVCAITSSPNILERHYIGKAFPFIWDDYKTSCRSLQLQ